MNWNIFHSNDHHNLGRDRSIFYLSDLSYNSRREGVCGPLPKTLMLFKTKVCHFPYLIYDLTKNSIRYLTLDRVKYLPYN